jgi:hypothetical protein
MINDFKNFLNDFSEWQVSFELIKLSIEKDDYGKQAKTTESKGFLMACILPSNLVH